MSCLSALSLYVHAQDGVDKWYLDTIKLCFHSPRSDVSSPPHMSEQLEARQRGMERDTDPAAALLQDFSTLLQEYQNTEQRAASLPEQCHLWAHLGKIRSELSHIQQALEHTARSMKGRSICLSKKTSGNHECRRRHSRRNKRHRRWKLLWDGRRRGGRGGLINTIEMRWSEEAVLKKGRSALWMRWWNRIRPRCLGWRQRCCLTPGWRFGPGRLKLCGTAEPRSVRPTQVSFSAPKHPTDRRPFNIWTRFVRPAR